jgi:hypothetical protein
MSPDRHTGATATTTTKLKKINIMFLVGFLMLLCLTVLSGASSLNDSTNDKKYLTAGGSRAQSVSGATRGIVMKSSSRDIHTTTSSFAARSSPQQEGFDSKPPPVGAIIRNNDEEAASMGKVVSNAMEQAMSEVSDVSPSARMLARSGRLSLNTKPGEAQSVASQIEKMVITDGGYIENSDLEPETYHLYNKRGFIVGDEKTRVRVNLKIRVPSDKFHDTIAAMQELVGKDMVERLSTSVEDFTDSYVDAASRAETLAASRKAMQVLLAKAGNVKEVLEVQRELNRLNQEYERQKANANTFQKMSALSTLHLDLQEQKEEAPEEEESTDSLGSSLSATFSKALNDSLSVYRTIFNVVIYACGVFVAAAIPCLFLYFISMMLFAKKQKILLSPLPQNEVSHSN